MDIFYRVSLTDIRRNFRSIAVIAFDKFSEKRVYLMRLHM